MTPKLLRIYFCETLGCSSNFKHSIVLSSNIKSLLSQNEGHNYCIGFELLFQTGYAIFSNPYKANVYPSSITYIKAITYPINKVNRLLPAYNPNNVKPQPK
ncbi:hypothetical protein ACKWTF_008943 [Chironomus riparius]